MTVRFVAASVLCTLLLAILAACSSDAPPTDDSAAPVPDAKAVQDMKAGGESQSPETSGDDEFQAAPPVDENRMSPFESRPDREINRRGDTLERFETAFADKDEQNLEQMFTRESAEAERDRSGADRVPAEELFAAAPVEDAERPRSPPDDDEQFAAAPPVPVTDAAAPILVDEGVTRSATLPTIPSAAPANAPPYWPRFHGPQGDNLSTDTGLLKKWPDEGPPQVWTVSGIGYGYSSISTANGLIYTAGNKDEQTIISAIDLEGNIRWQVVNGGAWTESFEGTRGTPTIDGDRLYHQSPVGNLVCLNARSGDAIWGLNSLKAFGGENITWALSESLLVDGDYVICCPGGSGASMVALNKLDGQTVWKTEPTGDRAGYSTPTIAEYNGLRMIFVMTSRAVIGVNADTGRLLFRHPFTTQYDVNVLKPIFHEGHLFVSGGYGTTGSQLLKINVAGDEVSTEIAWESKDLDNHHGGVLLVDGYLYGAAHKFSNGRWVCLDWATGETKWAERGIGKGSLTYADGMLYLLSENKLVGLAEPSPAGHEVISQFRLPAGGSGSSWAHPVVCGGRLYLRHADRLFAYDVRSRI